MTSSAHDMQPSILAEPDRFREGGVMTARSVGYRYLEARVIES